MSGNAKTLSLFLFSLTAVACAPVKFANQWSLVPHVAPEDANATEFQRRESERKHEIAALRSELLEIDEKLTNLYGIRFVREPRWYAGGLDLTIGSWYKEQRNDVEAALARAIVVSRRLALLTNRAFDRDPAALRASKLLQYVKNWKPKAIPYYR